MTQWFFYFMSIGVSGLTALLYLASAHAGTRLPAGKYWIGFLTRQNALVRLGIVGELTNHGRELEWGFSLHVVHVKGRTYDVLFVHYLSPPEIVEPAQLQEGQVAVRDAMRLLVSVVQPL